MKPYVHRDTFCFVSQEINNSVYDPEEESFFFFTNKKCLKKD